jgi:hypothetical protein
MAPEPASSSPEVAVHPAAEQQRFVIIVGGETAGLAQYVHHGGRWVFTHTEIDPSHEGERLGSVLARAALDHVAATGEQVVPLCPFITGWIERHSGYDRLVDHPFTEAVLRSQA